MTWAAFLKKNHNKYRVVNKGYINTYHGVLVSLLNSICQKHKRNLHIMSNHIKLRSKELLNGENTRVSTDNAYHLAISST